MRPVVMALRLAWAERACRWTAASSFAVLLPVYAATLPASLTGGRIGWVSLRLLTPEMAVVALALAGLLAQTVAFMVLIVRQGRRTNKSAATGGALMALITPLLCCSPILPLTLGTLAIAFPAVAGAGVGRVQGFIATHELSFLLTAVGLTAIAFCQNAVRAAAGAHCRIPASPATERKRS